MTYWGRFNADKQNHNSNHGGTAVFELHKYRSCVLLSLKDSTQICVLQVTNTAKPWQPCVALADKYPFQKCIFREENFCPSKVLNVGTGNETLLLRLFSPAP